MIHNFFLIHKEVSKKRFFVKIHNTKARKYSYGYVQLTRIYKNIFKQTNTHKHEIVWVNIVKENVQFTTTIKNNPLNIQG